MPRPVNALPFLLSLLVAVSACTGAAQPKTAPLKPVTAAAANAQPAAVSRADAEVKKTRGPSKPLFQVRLIQEAEGRTVRPAGEAALR